MPEESGTGGVSFVKQFYVAFAVSMCAFCVGFALAYTSPALPSLLDRKVTSFEVTPQMGSWVAGIMPLAAMVGALLGGPMVNYLGRRLTILASSVPFLLSYVIIAIAQSVCMVLCGRTLSGIALGIGSMAMPVYLGEALHPLVRGTFGVLPTLIGGGGIMICYVIGAITKWRQLAIAGGILCLPFMVLMFFVPETPRWYLLHGKEEQALKSLLWLNGKDSDAKAELQQMPVANTSEVITWRELLQKKYMKPFGIALSLMFFQQTSGYSAVLFYTVTIFNATGSSLNSYFCTIIVGTVNVVATLIAVMLIDRLGRKVLLCMSMLFMMVTLFILALYFYLVSLKKDLTSYGWVPLLGFIVYVLGFSAGIGPISWLMMGEILPTRIRGVAASIVVSFNWGCTFVVTKTFQDLLDTLGIEGAFVLFGLMCCLALVFIIIEVPETRNKTLEMIEAEMSK